MLAALHELPVRAGDALLVPAGTLHAIGAGILLLELQEPSDLSVLVEWQRFGVNSGAEHLSLGWDAALAAADRSAADASALHRRPGRRAAARRPPTRTSAPSAYARPGATPSRRPRSRSSS